MDDSKLNELIELLADLTLEAETIEVAMAALKLQTLLKAHYGDNLL